MYEKLFSEGKIGKMITKNRLVMSPMGMDLANFDGTVSDAQIAFYEARAKGGAGLIIPEICRVNDEHGAGLPRQLSVTRDEHIEPLSRLAAAIHKHDSKIFIQLHHPGNEGIPMLVKDGKLTSASAIPSKVVMGETRALETEEVKALIQQFIDGGRRVYQSGCDGVELHAGHGYLLQQFISPYTNKRTDEFGGSFENRLRMITEIIAGIRQACGPDFLIGVRLSVDEMLAQIGCTEPSITLPDGIEIAKYLERLGIDFLDVTVGLYETAAFMVEPASFPQGWRHDILKAVREHVRVPIIAVSHFREPTVCEKFLEEDLQDFISSGRSWLADEEWGRKIQEGREKELRKCMSCLRCIQSVEELAPFDQPVECAQNPRTCRELSYGELPPAQPGKSVTIIGAGPAGLCAAETLAKRGVKVTILDRGTELGGTVNLAKKPPHKDDMQWCIDYFAEAFKKLDVTVELNAEATAEAVAARGSDAVIVATGSVSLVPGKIPGIHGENVFTIEPILTGTSDLKGKKVAVIGAGITGIEVAEYLCAKGNQVSIVDMGDKIGSTAYISNVIDIKLRLDRYGAQFLLGHALKEILSDSVVLESTATQEQVVLPVDAVVLALGFCPDNAIAEDLKKVGCETYVIGSALKDGTIAPATRSGYELGRELFKV